MTDFRSSLSTRTAANAARPRVVVVTGASSGIGRATALAFARRGAHVVLAGRDADTLAPIIEECKAAGGQALAVATDVTDAAAVQALADEAIAHFGGVDVWINNVGVGVIGLFDKTPIESHRRVVEANLLGHMHGAHAILPHFRGRARGILINMISLGGWVPSPYAAAYSASKFGLRGFSEALRAEVSALPGVHVCEVYPTFVDTPGMSHGANYTGRRVKAPPPLVDPRRIASALVSLADRPRPSVYIGAPAFPGIVAHALAPDLIGRIMMWMTTTALDRAEPAVSGDGNLFQPSRGNAIDGGFRASTDIRKAQAAKAAIALGALGVLALVCRAARPGRPRNRPR